MARTGYGLGLQNTQLAAISSLQGLLLAPSSLDLRAPCLPGAAGSRALRSHPPPQVTERGGCAAAWLCSGCSSPLRPQVPLCALPWGLYSAFLQLHLIGWHGGAQAWHTGQVCFAEGWLCLAVCSCMQLASLPHSTGPGQR